MGITIDRIHLIECLKNLHILSYVNYTSIKKHAMIKKKTKKKHILIPTFLWLLVLVHRDGFSPVIAEFQVPCLCLTIFFLTICQIIISICSWPALSTTLSGHLLLYPSSEGVTCF